MPDRVRIELQPLGESFELERDTPLQDVLFAHGVEFPCGGRARCKGCRVRVVQGSLPITPEQEPMLTREELAAGWRLSCCSKAEGNLTLELGQWEAAILADNSLFEFTPRQGLGIAVDLGTTTIVVQLLDLANAHVLAVRTALNHQARHGADVMSRVSFGLNPDGLNRLATLVRKQIGKLISELLEAAGRREAAIETVTVVGNTVMHHLFCGIDVTPLSHYPFEPEHDGQQVFRAGDLGWNLAGDPAVRFLPCLGGFVGSDILAGILATKLGESKTLVGLVDLGTNGEIVIGNRERLLCASTAAGPAFEGARISMGMRAATGAISAVGVEAGAICCHVLGNVAPRGICGSGLVDAVAAGLDLGLIQPGGRLRDGANGTLLLCPPVALSQNDIRELQLAKGAIAAGIRLLLARWGAEARDLTRLYLAGAFGNYINRSSARRIGLLDFPLEMVKPAGNTALLGAKLALFNESEDAFAYAPLRAKVEHVSLNTDPNFQEVFVEEMVFPAAES
ncbi:MAG: ASKHA domain-containing protein [Acidobacteriia bacterium]|nr:ASKHA domain-containing protein [Terriglobia bacterium]